MPAGDRYVEVTLEDMEKFLKRAFRALRPKKTESRGEICFDLHLSDDEIVIRVFTSIKPRSGAGAGVGEDAIRVTMLTKGGKPLVLKQKIVMRTKNWRSALQDRIEDLHEAYEAKADYWKQRRRERDGDAPPERETWRSKQDEEAEAEIRQEQENSEDGPPPRRSEPPGPSVRKTTPATFEGEYRQLPSGGWGLQLCVEGRPGLEGIAATKGGKRTKVRLVEKVKTFRDKYKNNAECELWTFEDIAKARREQSGGGGGGSRWASDDLLATSVAERYLNP